MKRIFFAVLLVIAMFAMPAGAATKQDETDVLTLCNAATTAAAYCSSSAAVVGFTASKGTCHLSATGTAATSFTVSLYGSVDGTTYSALAVSGTATTITYTVATGANKTFSIINQPVKYIKGYYVSKVGGDATSAITMKCALGGN